MDTKEPGLMQRSIEIDMERIRKELCEQELLPGAYCQEYEIFKVIYRFVARRLKRTNESAYIILLTLTDRKGELPCLESRYEIQQLSVSHYGDRLIRGGCRYGCEENCGCILPETGRGSGAGAAAPLLSHESRRRAALNQGL